MVHTLECPACLSYCVILIEAECSAKVCLKCFTEKACLKNKKCHERKT